MQRIKSIDLARGFTVVFIPIVHSAMLYSKPDVLESVFGRLLVFIAEWPGAQVFMFVMGVSFAVTRQTSFKKVLVRSIVLLLSGYLLNALKFAVPFVFDGLPGELMNDVGLHSLQSFLLIGDIFHFASLTLIALFFVKQLPEYGIFSFLIAILVCFGSCHLWDLHSSNGILNHFYLLIGGKEPYSYFPLFPWIVYPFTGLAAGYFIKKDIGAAHVVLFFIGLPLYFIADIILDVLITDLSFYRPGSWLVVKHCAFVLVWISVLYWISEIVPDNFLFKFLIWCSRNISLIYVIQWPFIFWMLPVFGYRKLNLWESLVIGIDITLLVFVITYFIIKRKSAGISRKECDQT